MPCVVQMRLSGEQKKGQSYFRLASQASCHSYAAYILFAIAPVARCCMLSHLRLNKMSCNWLFNTATVPHPAVLLSGICTNQSGEPWKAIGSNREIA